MDLSDVHPGLKPSAAMAHSTRICRQLYTAIRLNDVDHPHRRQVAAIARRNRDLRASYSRVKSAQTTPRAGRGVDGELLRIRNMASGIEGFLWNRD